MAVTASMRLTPAEMALSLTMRNVPIRPVEEMCVPPQSSMDVPNRTVRTSSPYFSPKRAIAPWAFASSTGTCRCSSMGKLFLILAVTCLSTVRISSGVIFWKWEKSNRNTSGETYEPFCSTCLPNTSRNASCIRWVAEWLHSVAVLFSVSIRAVKVASNFSGSVWVRCTARLFSRFVSNTSIFSPPSEISQPESPTCPPISA